MVSIKSPLECYYHEFRVGSNSVAVCFSGARGGVIRELKPTRPIVMPGEYDKDKRQS